MKKIWRIFLMIIGAAAVLGGVYYLLFRKKDEVPYNGMPNGLQTIDRSQYPNAPSNAVYMKINLNLPGGAVTWYDAQGNVVKGPL